MLEPKRCFTPVAGVICMLLVAPLPAEAQQTTIEGVFALPGATQTVTGRLVVLEIGPLSRQLELTYSDKQTGRQIADFDVELTQQLHILAADDSLSHLIHEHADEVGADGSFTAQLDFPEPGLYHLYTDAVPTGRGQQVLRFDVQVGEAQGTTTATPVGDDILSGPLVSSDGPYTVSLDASKLRAATESTMSMTIEKDGAPAADLKPYLGVGAHAVFIRADDLAYVHAHATPASQAMDHQSHGASHEMVDQAESSPDGAIQDHGHDPAAHSGQHAMPAAGEHAGHSAVADPRWLTRPALFIHITTIAWWVGALVPLILLLRLDARLAAGPLIRFSLAIPFAIVPLIGSGLVLAIVQLGQPGPSWWSPYGQVLLAKLSLLVVLFAIASWNRWVLTAPAARGDDRALRHMRRGIFAEILIILAVLGLVSMWRFTPPPRALQAQSDVPTTLSLSNDALELQAAFSAVRTGIVDVEIKIGPGADGANSPRSVKLTLEPETGAISPVVRMAERAPNDTWLIKGLPVPPLAGIWSVEVEVRVTDFELSKVHGSIEFKQWALPGRLPGAAAAGDIIDCGGGRISGPNGQLGPRSMWLCH